MASTQELETRIAVLEDKIAFVMATGRMRGMISNGLLGPDGLPRGELLDGSILDFYLRHKTEALPVARAVEPPVDVDLSQQFTVSGIAEPEHV